MILPPSCATRSPSSASPRPPPARPPDDPSGLGIDPPFAADGPPEGRYLFRGPTRGGRVDGPPAAPRAETRQEEAAVALQTGIRATLPRDVERRLADIAGVEMSA